MATIIGILNVTNDSFSDGSLYKNKEELLIKVQYLFDQGADIVDIGGESSNPQSKEISLEEEQRRLIPVLDTLFVHFPERRFSLDTRKKKIAEYFLKKGGYMINDYAGLTNNELISTVKKYGCPYVIMHFPGKSIQEVHSQEKIDDVEVVYNDLLIREKELVQCGIQKEKIILDPGIGFGKTRECNWKLLTCKKYMPGKTVYIGFSRKRFLGENRLQPWANREAGVIALDAGTDYIRLHEPGLLA